ncbi:MAG TPA: ornithine carbamoyltransferase [Methanomassiliicoccales archaeon]|nr:ornithine carbamoyltransferase [Methanomassiliicoccales archaeon]
MKLDLISILDVKDDLEDLLDSAMRLKGGALKEREPLKGKTLAMIFEKSSTRTRVSFEAGMAQLGGHALYLSPKEMQMGRGETVGDTAKVLSRYVDAIMYRAFSHDFMKELAKNATVPVINGLDDVEHPCQALADLMTIKEQKDKFEGLKVAYVGDGDNVCNSLMLGSAIVGMNFAAACPKGYQPKTVYVAEGKKIARKNGCRVEIVEQPAVAANDADVLYTDTWVSMGEEAEAKQREKVFKPYQINKALLKKAKHDAIVMHCLPAHRGMEITADVIDGPQSVVFEQAENRLHTEKAVLLMLIR